MCCLQFHIRVHLKDRILAKHSWKQLPERAGTTSGEEQRVIPVLAWISAAEAEAERAQPVQPRVPRKLPPGLCPRMTLRPDFTFPRAQLLPANAQPAFSRGGACRAAAGPLRGDPDDYRLQWLGPGGQQAGG